MSQQTQLSPEGSPNLPARICTTTCNFARPRPQPLQLRAPSHLILPHIPTPLPPQAHACIPSPPSVNAPPADHLNLIVRPFQACSWATALLPTTHRPSVALDRCLVQVGWLCNFRGTASGAGMAERHSLHVHWLRIPRLIAIGRFHRFWFDGCFQLRRYLGARRRFVAGR